MVAQASVVGGSVARAADYTPVCLAIGFSATRYDHVAGEGQNLSILRCRKRLLEICLKAKNFGIKEAGDVGKILHESPRGASAVWRVALMASRTKPAVRS